jgi:hypothetical protein
MNLTPEQAHDLIPVYDQQDICVELRRGGNTTGEIAEKTMWLVYLCSKCDTNSVKEFIQSTHPNELRTILNTKLSENWDGTVLHAVCYWNNSNKAVNLFELLVEHGADPVRDYYGLFPWENNAPKWVVPFGTDYIGNRDPDAFEEMYNYLRYIYEPEQKRNQNASPIADPDADLVTRIQEIDLIPQKLYFDDCQEDCDEDYDYSDMPALVSDTEYDDY